MHNIQYFISLLNDLQDIVMFMPHQVAEAKGGFFLFQRIGIASN